MANRKHKKKLGKWQKRGIYAACVILGLAMGFAAGFYIEREFKHKKATSPVKTGTQAKKSSASSTNEEASSSATSSAEKQSSETSATQTATSAVTPQPGPVASTPAQAMRKFLQTKGISTSGMSFSVVSVSKADPRWKLDRGTSSGKPTLYFLLHNVTGGWAVVDYGETLTAERMSAAGAPADLPAP